MMRASGTRLRDDEGFSIVELLFAAMLGVMVLTFAYLIMDTALASFRRIEASTTASTTAARASYRLSKPIREMQPPVVHEPYEIEFLADASGDDGVMEWVRFEVEPGTRRLVEATRSVDIGSEWGPKRLIGDNIENRLQSVPLFTYYSDPASSPLAPADIRSSAKVVRLVVLTRGPGVPEPPLYRVQTDVFLRNANK